MLKNVVTWAEAVQSYIILLIEWLSDLVCPVDKLFLHLIIIENQPSGHMT